jgi:RNA polymerase sigma-54 factor
MMKPMLQLRASAALVMTPQVQQSLHLLQLSALEFHQELQAALASNPFLEAAETGADDSAAEAAETDDASDAPADEGIDDSALDFDSGAAASQPAADDDADSRSSAARAPGLREHLRTQIGASRMSERDRMVAVAVAEALDADGYLRLDPNDIISALPELQIGSEELAIGLRFVQSLDPPGVAARTPSECLALQLDRLPADVPGRALAQAIVRDHLKLLAAHDTLRLRQALDCDDDALREANALILRLDPHPGERFAVNAAPFVVADVIVHRVNGKWRARINPQVLPNVRVNQRYVEMLRAEGAAAQPLAQQLQEARWLLRNVRQRFRTIQRVAQAIVDRQRRYFEHGDIAMQPLLQRDVAHDLGMHESTVSRVANGKYMACPRGLIEFRRFFGSHVHATDGRACSATAVHALIRDLIAAEDPARPLSDIKLMRKLAERGVRVARRTVTKYRDSLRIAPWQARQLAPPR